jgi:hypothetical protein
MHKFIRILSLLTLLMLAATPFNDAEAVGRIKARGATANAQGGVTGGSASAARGPNGGAAMRGRAYTTDGQGNGQAASGGVVRTPAGGYGARAGSTTWNADGSAQHQSGAAAQGPNGSAQTSGGFTHDSTGNVTGGRSTSAQGAAGRFAQQPDWLYLRQGFGRSTSASGQQGSVNAQTQVTQDGRTVTRTCTDANGNVVPCPQW